MFEFPIVLAIRADVKIYVARANNLIYKYTYVTILTEQVSKLCAEFLSFFCLFFLFKAVSVTV